MRGRKRNDTRMIAGIVLSLGLALGSLPTPGIVAAEPEGSDILSTAEAQNVTEETPAEEIWAQTEIEAPTDGVAPGDAENFADAAAEALRDGAVSGDLENSMKEEEAAEVAAAAGAAAETMAAGQSAGAVQDGQEIAEEEALLEEEAIAEPESAEASVPMEYADVEADEVPVGDSGLISGIEIIAIEEAGTAAADDTAGALVEASTPVSGDCGVLPGTVTWELDESGTLKVSGSGDMLSWESPEQAPWDALRGEIRGIEIAEGVTSVGAYAFCGCDAAETVEVAESVSVIGEAAFSHCSGFTAVSIG